MMISSKFIARGSLLSAAFLLGACNSSGGGTATNAGTADPQPNSSSTPQFTYGTLTPGTAPAVAVSVLTENGGVVGSTSGSFDPSSDRLTAGGNSYGITDGSNRYVAFVDNGAGGEQIAAVETQAADMPTSGSASYNGTARVVYTDTPNTRRFEGTMDATVTANFAPGGTVSLDLANPNGQMVVGANPATPYSGAGRMDIDGLAISGTRYEDAAGSTASVTGFTGGTDLNGAPTVDALGVFAGPQAAETAGAASIADGANGNALIQFTARQ